MATTSPTRNAGRSLHVLPMSRLAWLGLGLLLLSIAGFTYGVIVDTPSQIIRAGDHLVLPPAVASIVVVLLAIARRHERSITAVVTIVLAVLWILVVRRFEAG